MSAVVTEAAKTAFGPVRARTLAKHAEHVRLWAVIDLERAIADGDVQRVADLAAAIKTTAETMLDKAMAAGAQPQAGA